MKRKAVYTAWGEARTFPEWKKDPRVAEGLKSNVLCNRIKRGWSVEAALSKPISAYCKRSIEAKQLRENMGLTYQALYLRKKKCELVQMLRPKYTHTHNKITAWGETKLLWEWMLDPRKNVDVSAKLFSNRIYLGWSAEDALSTPPMRKKTEKNDTTKHG